MSLPEKRKGRPRLLVVNQYFPPDTSATARYIQQVVEELTQAYKVTVLCGRPSYRPEERHPWYLYRWHDQGRYRVLRVGSTAFDRTRWWGRLFNYVTYLKWMFFAAVFMRTNVLLVMTDPPGVAVVAAVVAALKGIPMVYNIRDLHPDMAVASGLIRTSWLVRLWDRLHRWAIRRARAIVVLGDDMKERVVAKGAELDRVHIVRDGAAGRFTTKVSPAEWVTSLRNGFRFTLVHAGNMGFAGAWDTLLQAARVLRDEGVGFVFIGDGVERPRLERACRDLWNVRFFDYQPEEQLPRVLQAPDMHVITLKSGLAGLVVPSKLYPVLLAGKPVLALVPHQSDVARIVKRLDCGVVVDPDDLERLVQAIRWCRDHRAELTKMGVRARAGSREFLADVQLKKFHNILKVILNSEL